MRKLDLTATSVKNSNNCNKQFDWEQYEQTEQAKQSAHQNKIQNLQDEIDFYNKRIAKKKKDIAKAERAIRVAERELKAAKEAERARKIKSLLEANAERIVIFTTFSDEILPLKGKDVVVYLNANKCWCLKVIGEGNRWELALEYVDDVFVKAEL